MEFNSPLSTRRTPRPRRAHPSCPVAVGRDVPIAPPRHRRGALLGIPCALAVPSSCAPWLRALLVRLGGRARCPHRPWRLATRAAAPPARCVAWPPVPPRRALLVRPVVARTSREPRVAPHMPPAHPAAPDDPPKTMHPANCTSPDAMQGRSYARDNSDGHLDCPSSVFISLPSWQLSCPPSWRASDSRISDKRHPRVQCRTTDNGPASCRA